MRGKASQERVRYTPCRGWQGGRGSHNECGRHGTGVRSVQMEAVMMDNYG